MATEQLSDTPVTINGLTLRPSVRKAWVEALRSGEYQQTKHKLRDASGYCCLGVLCDVASKAGRGSWAGDSFGGIQTLPPFEVEYWAGTNAGWWVELEGQSKGLFTLNDVDGYTFEQIADLIEGV